jgi:HlyD family secretion protein
MTMMAGETLVESPETIQATQGTGLPVVIPEPRPSPRRARWRRVALAAVVVLAAGAGGAAWWFTHGGPAVPPGIAWSNGRLEADQIDINTKFAGRIATVLADEGDVVHAGQVVARMDTGDLEASLRQAEAQIAQAEHSIAAVRAEQEQAVSQTRLSAQELDRARSLLARGYQTQEVVDQRQSQFDIARAVYGATQARIEAATSARDAAGHSADVIRINIADSTLAAPRDGPVQYRLANIGEVLGPGGRVFSMLDMGYVYMDIFLPTADAGRIELGADARIVLDALPQAPVPAKVVFIASQNQFTPKMVETKSERDRLMFRVRVRIDPDLTRAHAAQIRAGLPGLAYIRLDPQVPWPSALQPRADE